MASAPATAPRRPACPRSGGAGEPRYRLAPGCQVRAERFGLLFYDLAGPRLLFAETGDLFAPSLFRDGGSPGEELRGRSAAERRRAARFLDLLVKKGFLHGQPLR